ncbi:phosphoribulokinase family protein-related protein [Anaeramoeba flamelloides]|uniref:Phosphoribulokinase family protein-related protein n=1 Tax=Anaeramoeba flamelloides TaxID=1746091 RepID=A0AAV7ZUS9_9EUKA|nr:phosphoribulokinase family protein-related protein [Anaeramoeba flamelloides]
MSRFRGLVRQLIHEDLSSLIGRLNVEGEQLQKIDRKESKIMVTRKHLRKTQNTLSFLLVAAYGEIMEDREIAIVHSFGDGYFFRDKDIKFKLDTEDVTKLKNKIQEYIEDEEKIEKTIMKRTQLVEIFKKKSWEHKLGILNTWRAEYVPILKFKHHLDYIIEPVTPKKHLITFFDLKLFHGGIVLRFPTLGDPQMKKPFSDRPKLFELIQERDVWAELLDTAYIDELNDHIYTKKIDRLKWVAEGLHGKKLRTIASKIAESFPSRRIVSIAGPSSSGKTTFAKRLSIDLAVLGLKARVLSLDDYFVDVEDMTLDKNGERDYEDISVVNMKLLIKRLKDLLDGEKIPERCFDFVNGVGTDNFEKMWSLGEKELLIIEGIHGLNPKFTSKVGDKNIWKIYVSALTQLNIDIHHRISTSDCRLLRRIIRDYQFRGWNPKETLKMWGNVRKGEEKNIFPYQELTDFTFNTSLVYELPVISIYVRQLLAQVKGDKELRVEAARLMKFLSFFFLLSPERVPGISILREFIGNSDFRY